METFSRDFRFALRTLHKDWRTSLVAIAVLALGIGASTVVFSVVYNSFFEALPYKNFRQSVVVLLHNSGSVGATKDRDYFSIEEFRAFREQNHVFEEVIAYNGIRLLYDDGTSSRYWPHGAIVTANTFEYFGVAPLLGRPIEQEDAKPDAPPVFVANYRFWQEEFGGHREVIGKTFVLDGKPTTLVGVMPSQFNAFEASVWLPATIEQLAGGCQIIGRLKKGVSPRTAAANLDAIAHRLHKPKSPGHFRDQTFPEEKFVIVAPTLLDSLIGNFTKTLYVLLAAVLLLMLLACSNVANLFLVRATTREREIALRAALGATRRRLIWQLLVECFVVSVVACGTGCGLAYFGLKVVLALIPNGILPDAHVIRMNLAVFCLSIGLTILTTVLCALAPAFHALHRDLLPHLSGSGTSPVRTSPHGTALRTGLVVSEVALSIILLIGAGLLMRSFFILTRVDLGFNPQSIFYFQIELPKQYNSNYSDSLARKNALTRQLLDRLQVLPGLTYVSEQNNMPPLESEVSNTIIPGKPHAEPWESNIEECSEEYFPLLGLQLLRGRLFSRDDVLAARYVAVVNEEFSRRYFPNEDPLGHKIKFDLFDRPYLAAPRDAYFEVVGVVRDFKTRDYDNPSWQTAPAAFVPYSVANYSWRSFMVRTSLDPNSLPTSLNQQVRSLDPGVRISQSGTLESALKKFYRGPQFELATLMTFAAIGLILMVVGIFSVMAYSVSVRTHEIGVRMALGAREEDVVRLVLLGGSRILATGIVIGLVCSYILARFLASQISGVAPTDPWTFTCVALLALCVGLAACVLPAFRGAAVDPLVALRYE